MIMNKKLTYSLCAAAFLLTGCDYNEDNFPGYMDEAQAEQIAYYEGDFVGSYPIEGYFTLNKGNETAEAEDRATIEAALVDMLKEMYPYCDAGSSAKVTVKIATITPGVEEPEVSDDYTLVDADYEALGEEPASHHNFAYYMDVNAYLVQFCNMKYPDATEGTIVKLTYDYYANYTTSTISAFYQKTADSWEEFVNYQPDETYTLTDADYEYFGTEYGEPGKHHNFDANMSEEQINFYLASVAERKFGYLAEGSAVSLTYAYYSDGSVTNLTLNFKKEAEGWVSFDPSASVSTIADLITVLKYDGSNWTMTNLISGVERYTLSKAEYTILTDWVSENKPEYMSTQGYHEDYYFGSSPNYGNINNRYSTWISYYNVDGYLDDLSDAEIQAIMDERLANEGIAPLLLPVMVAEPNPDFSYEVTYTVYGGRGNGDYAMSFYYNAEEDKFEWDELSPIKK